MNCISFTPLFVACSLLAGGSSVVAQSIVIPKVATNAEGNDGQDRHFENNPFRSQQVVLGSSVSVGGSVMTIDGIGYRPDSNLSSGAPNGATFSDVVVRLSHTSMTPAAVSATFATNIGGATQTTVFDSLGGDGPVVVPAWSSANGGPAPFFNIAFHQSFQFDPNHLDGPNLLIDITSAVAPGVFLSIDGSRAGGYSQEIGTSGPESMPDPYAPFRLLVDGASRLGSPGGNRAGMAPGDEFELFAAAPAYLVNAPAVVLFGFGPSPAPIPLTLVGAPGNSLYTNTVLSVPGIWSFSPISGDRILQVLNVSSNTMIGLQVNAQVAVVDLAANSLGVITSNGVEMHIGETAANHPLGQVASNNHTSPTGFVQFGTIPGVWGGACLKLSGPGF